MSLHNVVVRVSVETGGVHSIARTVVERIEIELGAVIEHRGQDFVLTLRPGLACH